MRVHVHELNLDFLECSLGEKVTFDSAKCFVRVVVSLLYERKFFAVPTVETDLKTKVLLQSFQRQNKQLRVMFVGQWREWHWSELSAF